MQSWVLHTLHALCKGVTCGEGVAGPTRLWKVGFSLLTCLLGTQDSLIHYSLKWTRFFWKFLTGIGPIKPLSRECAQLYIGNQIFFQVLLLLYEPVRVDGKWVPWCLQHRTELDKVHCWLVREHSPHILMDMKLCNLRRVVLGWTYGGPDPAGLEIHDVLEMNSDLTIV